MIRRIGAGVLSLACFDHASRPWADPPPVAAVEAPASRAASWREGLSLQVGAIALGQASGDHSAAPIVGVRGAFRPNYRFTLLGGYDLTWHDQTVADLGATDRIHRLYARADVAFGTPHLAILCERRCRVGLLVARAKALRSLMDGVMLSFGLVGLDMPANIASICSLCEAERADSSAAEHRPYKPGATGSNPVPPTN